MVTGLCYLRNVQSKTTFQGFQHGGTLQRDKEGKILKNSFNLFRRIVAYDRIMPNPQP